MASGQTFGSMHFRLLALGALLITPAFPQGAVTVDPACPSLSIGDDWSRGAPTITIRYKPNPSARKWNLVLADSIGASQLREQILPMTRLEDGSWQVVYTPQKVSVLGYSMFFFQADDNRADNNQGQYWEILHCFHGQVAESAIDMQASTYEGRLLAPGIQRMPDLERALAIVKADLKAHPAEGEHYFFLWDFELKKGNYSPAAYAQVGTEVDTFLNALGSNLSAMQQIIGFVAGQQRKLPPGVVQRFRRAWSELPQTSEPIQINAVTKEVIHIPLTDARAIEGRRARVQKQVTRGLAQLDYSAIDSNESDPYKRADAYLAFAAKYPPSPDLPNPYWNVFLCEKEIGDLTAAETIVEKWTSSNPADVQPLLEMAKFYLERKTKPNRVLELLAAVQKIYQQSDLPTSHNHYRREPGRLESLRGQAHLLLKDLPAARADFAAAAEAAPDKPGFAYQLGQTCERMGDKAGALDAYLSAASAPYQENSEPGEAYERLFVEQRKGSRKEAGEQIARRSAERTLSTAAEYIPVAKNRPAPEFAFVDLHGKPFDNQAVKGKPTVITFWGIWCPPCIAELPAMEEFQKRHSDVNLLAVAIGNTPEQVKTFLAAHNLNALHVAAQTDWPEAFGTTGAPTSLVLDRFGQIQFLHSGKLPNVEAILGKDISALPEPN